MRHVIAIAVVVVLASGAGAQSLLPTQDQAVALALADAKQLDDATRLATRYLWVHTADVELAQALSHAINMNSRTGLIRRPFAIGKGPLLLLRVDARYYASRADDLAQWLSTWEELRFDPEFNLLLTKDSLRFVTVKDFGRPWVNGDKVEIEAINLGPKKGKKAKVDSVVRVLPPDMDHEHWLELANAVLSTAPIVRADYFVARALASIRDADKFDGIYDAIYGGLYPRFVGQPNTLDELLENLGIGNVKAKISKENVFDKLRSDRRTAQFRSKVAAGRPRSVEFLPHLAGSVFDSERLLSITSDLKRANIDIGVHPLLILYKGLRKPDAHETIFDSANGLHGYALHDGDGNLQEKAPDDVVKDHTVPAPYYGELQYPISCLACHEAEGSGGWQDVQNDAQKLIRNRRAIPFDLNFVDQADAVDRIATLFSGDPKGLLKRGRDNYAAAVLAATGPWKRSEKNQTDIVALSSGKLVQVWRDYFYGDITAERALAEIGVKVQGEKAIDTLNALLPPIAIEDPRIAALQAGIAIERNDWNLVARLVSARARESLKTNPKLLEDRK